MRTTYGSGTPVQAARFSTVSWQTQPQRAHIDSCGSTPAFVKIRRSSWSASTAGLVLTDDDTGPARPPADLPGVTALAQPDGTRLWRIDEQTTLMDGACRLVLAGAFLQNARRSGETHVVFTN